MILQLWHAKYSYGSKNLGVATGMNLSVFLTSQLKSEILFPLQI